MAQEFIIGLTEHRTLGHIFQAFQIVENGAFYSISRIVKPHDIDKVQLREDEKELVNLIDQYSEEKLVKKFAKKKDSSQFFQRMDPEQFIEQISPYIDNCMSDVVSILMKHNTRLFFKQAKYSNLYDDDLIHVPSEYAECSFHFHRTDEGTRYNAQIKDKGNKLKLTHKNMKVVANSPCMLYWQNRLYLFESISAKRLIPFFEKEYIFIPKQIEDKYYQSFVLNTIRDFPVVANGFEINESKDTQQAILSLEPNLNMEAIILPKFSYGENEFLSNSESNTSVSLKKINGSYQFDKIQRDRNWEKLMLDKIESLGLQKQDASYSPKQVHLLSTEDRLYELIQWLNKHRIELQKEGYRIEQNQYEKNYSTASHELEIEIKSSDDWFDIYAKVRFGDYEIPFIKLKRNILNGIREFELPNGEIAILPKEWFTDFGDLLPFTQTDGDHLKLKKHHYQLLQKRLKGIDKSFYQRLAKIGETNKTKIPLPSNIQAKLRVYQEDGFSWMYHLNEHQFGGCLADDMGLGKTLQTLTLLLKLKRQQSAINIPQFDEKNQLPLFDQEVHNENHQAASLIVMPTSLIHNWENEIKKFAPSLKVYKHVGVQRKKSLNLQGIINYYDIILTTYGTVRNDVELLKAHEFFYFILDESQYIKNSVSKTHKAISALHARFRLVLTGTPIENSLSDLWSQFNFLNKGLLGNLAYFKREFITPIEKKNDLEKQEKLQTLIRPFVLRRKKEDVAKDLPALTEQTRFCGMTKQQKSAYEKERAIIRNNILQNIEKDGVEKSTFLVLQGLTKLRQLANHPSMLTGEENQESGKFDEIFHNLKNLMAENHKVLIFSSFVTHLELLQQKIESEKWKYAILTGQTTNREKVIGDFQNDPNNRIFLISLKAGGVGLNLTSADYVFIIDPWWNPAAENQAINRAHRIGQDKKVFVYRFITEGSIEEKIQLLQNRKSLLAEKFINSNNPFKAVTKDEIIGLLS